MDKHKEFYADAANNISVQAGMVRIDFASMTIDNDNDNDKTIQPLTHRQRCIMPIDGFVETFNSMLNIMEQLKQQGVISARENY